MKKIEEEFLRGLDKSFEYNKSFDDIKDKINIVRFQKVNGSSRALYRIWGVIVAFVLFVAIVIPVAISVFNSNRLNSGLSGDSSIGGTSPKDPADEGTPPTGDLPDYDDDKKIEYSVNKTYAVQFFSADETYDITSVLLVYNVETNNKVLEDMAANQTGSDYPNIFEALSNGKFDEEYFETNALVICPFVYSSSERDIELNGCYVNHKENSLDLYFSLYSPEYVDNDLWIEFFLLEIKKESLAGADNLTGKIHVLNTRDNSNRSAYYGLNQE